MKICMIGLGSIGCRHLKNLAQILCERSISFQIDALRSKSSPLNNEVSSYITQEYFNIDSLPTDYDIIFITNPTNLHYETILSCIDKAKYFFIEKPLFHDINISLSNLLQQQNKNKFYVACPLRFNPVIRYLKDNIAHDDLYSVRAISSSYLPDWRPEVDYKTNYSAHKNQGGGVSLDLIHEWDYITYLFGIPNTVYNISGKFSCLDIDSDDLSIYIAHYQDKLVELHLDYFGRNPQRKIELYTRDYTVYGDLLNRTIIYKGHTSKTLNFEAEDIYINEMNYFIDTIINGTPNFNNIEHANYVLNIALGGI